MPGAAISINSIIPGIPDPIPKALECSGLGRVLKSHPTAVGRDIPVIPGFGHSQGSGTAGEIPSQNPTQPLSLQLRTFHPSQKNEPQDSGKNSQFLSQTQFGGVSQIPNSIWELSPKGSRAFQDPSGPPRLFPGSGSAQTFPRECLHGENPAELTAHWVKPFPTLCVPPGITGNVPGFPGGIRAGKKSLQVDFLQSKLLRLQNFQFFFSQIPLKAGFPKVGN